MVTIEENNLLKQVETVFHELFGVKNLIVRSPGRINLIGEHTDYNHGFVLPAAIDKAVYFAIGLRNDEEVHLYATNMQESYQTRLDSLSAPPFHWSAYVLGVVDQLQRNGFPISGFNAVINGEIPIGAGMSSSAGLECATVFALKDLFQLELDTLDMIKLAQKAENEFVGVKCGIMDMFASMLGKKNMAIQLDCHDLSYKYFPFALRDYKIVLFDTRVKHSLAGGEYNLRRQQCEEGVDLLQKIYPQVKSLRDVNISMLQSDLIKMASSTVFNRCCYVVEENLRLLKGCELLLGNDIAGFGKKMYASHEGLSKLYEVSCNELDLLVELAKKESSIAGARMMGGGFGGCTINLIREVAIDDIYNRFEEEYFQETGQELKMYITTAQDGTSKVC